MSLFAPSPIRASFAVRGLLVAMSACTFACGSVVADPLVDVAPEATAPLESSPPEALLPLAESLRDAPLVVPVEGSPWSLVHDAVAVGTELPDVDGEGDADGTPSPSSTGSVAFVEVDGLCRRDGDCPEDEACQGAFATPSSVEGTCTVLPDVDALPGSDDRYEITNLSVLDDERDGLRIRARVSTRSAELVKLERVFLRDEDGHVARSMPLDCPFQLSQVFFPERTLTVNVVADASGGFEAYVECDSRYESAAIPFIGLHHGKKMTLGLRAYGSSSELVNLSADATVQ